MKTFFRILSWVFGGLFIILFILSLLSGHYIMSILILLAGLILIPPVQSYIQKVSGFRIPAWIRAVLIPLVFVLFVYGIFSGMGNEHSIYKNPEIEAQLMAIYNSRMDQWPVPYQERFIQNRYGKVYVIQSGEKSAPPLFLLHASAMASWSWLYNVAGLTKHYRIYAIDTIGDAGRSTLNDLTVYPGDGGSLADLYGEIMDSPGVRKAVFMGASQGGFIATNMALYAPERVEKLLLCGPMGYGGTTGSVLRIVFTTMFPFRPIRESTTNWAFGGDPAVNQAAGEWFRLILNGVISRQTRLISFSHIQLQSISIPVLLLLGKRDGLVGDPENTIQPIRDIPNFWVELLDTGHLISVGMPEQFNRYAVNFIGKKSDTGDKKE